ncbi:hypothetical protein [Parasediminibacterium sp. JCM 36343]
MEKQNKIGLRINKETVIDFIAIAIVWAISIGLLYLAFIRIKMLFTH